MSLHVIVLRTDGPLRRNVVYRYGANYMQLVLRGNAGDSEAAIEQHLQILGDRVERRLGRLHDSLLVGAVVQPGHVVVRVTGSKTRIVAIVVFGSAEAAGLRRRR